MFKSSIVVPTWILIACGLTACTISPGNEPGHAGLAGSAGSAGTGEVTPASSIGGKFSKDSSSGLGGATSATGSVSGKAASAGTYAGQAGVAGGPAVSCTKRGPVTIDTVWEPLAGCPDGFEVPDYVEVKGAGTTLTIKPGVTLIFASSAGILVDTSAAMVAVGTAAQPITFTGWQKLAGSWSGISFFSSSLDNEISNAIIEYGGDPNGSSAAIVLSSDVEYGRLKLSNTQIRNNAKFGVTLYAGVTLAQFENNTITKNDSGAVRTDVRSVHQLNGTGNSLVDNGKRNIVHILTNSIMQLDSTDVTWPNLSPAVYHVTDADGASGDQIYVKRHLTIEAGAVFEFVGGAGIDVSDGSSGISAIGTTTLPIVFRGVDGSGWTGIGICESGWTGNALEEVRIANAAGYPHAFSYCGSGASSVRRPSVVVGHNFSSNASQLRIKNIKMSGPNNAPSDIFVKGASVLTQEGTNSGTGANGALAVQAE